jgi:excisionase family DNA binding protein
MEQANSGQSAFEPRLGRSVSIEQAAQMLGVSRRTIYNRIRDGRLQTIRTLGGSQRVLVESVQMQAQRSAADWPSTRQALRVVTA